MVFGNFGQFSVVFWWFLVVFFVVLAVFGWFLIVFGSLWQFWVVSDGFWQFLVVFSWFLVVLGSFLQSKGGQHIAVLYFSVIWVVKYSTRWEPPIGGWQIVNGAVEAKNGQFWSRFLQNVRVNMDPEKKLFFWELIFTFFSTKFGFFWGTSPNFRNPGSTGEFFRNPGSTEQWTNFLTQG